MFSISILGSSRASFDRRKKTCQIDKVLPHRGGNGLLNHRHSNRYTPQREVQVAFKVSMTHYLCISHYVSHFAAFFIVMGTETSVAESVLDCFGLVAIEAEE